MNKEQAIEAAQEIDKRYLQPNCPLQYKTNDGFNMVHIRWMIEEMRRGKMDENKTMRWLGYIQGIMVGRFGVPLEEMKELSTRVSGKVG